MHHTCNDNVQNKILKKREKKGKNVKHTNRMAQSTAEDKYDQHIKRQAK